MLVVGAGPAGLTAAITLARAGIEVMLIERRKELSSLPRATTVSIRSMEIFRGWGLEDEIRAIAPEVEWQGWLSETLASADRGEAWATGIPTLEQSAVISPTTPVCAAQDELEPILLAHLRSQPGSRVLLGAELIELETGGGEVAATVRLSDGGVRRVRASHLIGADGAHSVTRRLLGIEMDVGTAVGTAESARSVLFRAPSGTSWATTATASTRSPTAMGPRRCCPRAVTGGSTASGSTRRTQARCPAPTSSCAKSASARASRICPSRSSGRAPYVRGGHGGHLQASQRVPRGRRGPPGDAPGRDRHEHGDPQRLRPRLEAVVGATWLGPSPPPGFL